MNGIERLDESSAHDLDTAIRAIARQVHIALDALYTLVEQARATNIHEALGFPSWTAYIADALDGQWKLKRDKRAEVVRFLAEQGMSQRAIAKVTGASRNTVHRDLDEVAQLSHLITGLDGKSYPRPEVAQLEPPAVEQDHALDRERSHRLEELMALRWHWTLDESNPARVSIAEYARQVGASESAIGADANGWAAYRAAGADEQFVARMANSRTFTIPGTVAEMIDRMQQIAEDEMRLRRIKFEMELAAIKASDEPPAWRNAREFGLRLRYLGRDAREAIEGGMSVEEYAESVGVSAATIRDHLDALNEGYDDEEEGQE